MKWVLVILLAAILYSNTAFSSTTIDAQVIRNQSGSGTTQISAGFPFPPGLVTEAMITGRTIKITVGGTEVAANVSALRGRHSDGTIRSALIQFTRTMAQSDVVAAQVIVDGGTRTDPDPAYVRPTITMVQSNNVILPTDSTYLTTTLITFQHLLPTGGGSAAEEAQYTSLADDRFDSLVSSQRHGTASYENARGMLTLWARSGNKKYFNEAVNHVLTWLPDNTPGDSASQPCNSTSTVNPDGLPATDETACGLLSEWNAPRFLSYASMYLLTGYRDFWSQVAYNVQAQQNSIIDQNTADTGIIRKDSFDNPRFNYAKQYGALIAAMMIDATMPVNGQWFEGRTANWADQLNWTLNAIKNTEWNLQWIPFETGSGSVPIDGTTISKGAVTANLLGVYEQKGDPKVSEGAAMPASGYLQVNAITGGSFSAGPLSGIAASATGAEISDYRQGMTGTRSNSPRVDPFIPTFQLIFPTNFLIDYYLQINADSRIPAMVKKNLDIILQQIRPMVPGDTYYGAGGGAWGNPVYGKPYALKNPIDTGDAEPFELPEYARIIAFVLKTSGEATVNGATYSEWYTRCIDTANNTPISVLTWEWKHFGQFYGFGADTPWIMAQSSLPGSPGFRTPTNYVAMPGDAPDIEGNRGRRLSLAGRPIKLVEPGP